MTPTRSVVCSVSPPPPPPPPASSSSPQPAIASAAAIPSATSKPRRIGPPSSDGGRIHQTIWLLRGAAEAAPHQLFGFFVEHLLGDGERGVCGGHAAVDRGLEQDLLDLVGAETVAAGGADVHRELVLMAAGDERGERDRAVHAAVESRPGPDLAPRVPRDQVLERGGEGGRALDRGV